MPNTVTYKDWLFVKVPKGASSYKIKNGTYVRWLSVDGRKYESLNFAEHLRIVAKGDQLHELQCRDIVDRIDDKYFKCYTDTKFKMVEGTPSFHSLLKSLGMEPSETLILKKNKK